MRRIGVVALTFAPVTLANQEWPLEEILPDLRAGQAASKEWAEKAEVKRAGKKGQKAHEGQCPARDAAEYSTGDHHY